MEYGRWKERRLNISAEKKLFSRRELKTPNTSTETKFEGIK